MSGKIIVTRPINSAKRFGAQLEQFAFEPLYAPMLEIKGCDFKVPSLSDYQAVIFTSAHAVRFFSEKVQEPDIAVYVVGSQTAFSAQSAGYNEIYSADGDVQDLISMISNEAPDTVRPFLYVRGVHIRSPLDDLLADEGFSVDEVVVYDAKAVDGLPLDIVEAINDKSIQAITFFSKRTAQNFLRCADLNGVTDSLDFIKVLCISDSVLECVQAISWAETHVSDEPNGSSMLDLVTRVCVSSTDRAENNTESKNDQKERKMSAAKKSNSIDNASDIIERFGGIRPMAKKMDVAVTTVQGWKKRDTIPGRRREAVIAAAQEHDIDLSDVLEEASSISNDDSDTNPANENTYSQPVEKVESEAEEAQETEEASEMEVEDTGSDDDDIAERTQKIAGAVESVFDNAEPVMLDDTAPETSVPNAGTGLKAEPRTLDRRLQQTESNAIKKSTWINVSLILLVIAAVGAYMLFGGQDKANEQRLGALEEDLGTLRGDVDEVKGEQSFLKTMIPQDLDDRIQRIQDQAIEAQQKVNQAIATARVVSNDVLGEDAGTIEERVAKLQEYAAGSEQIQVLLARLQGMSDSVMGQNQIDQTIASINEALANKAPDINLDETLANIRESAPNVGETFAEVPKEELKAAAMLLGMTQLRGALNRDNEAFADDLQLLKNMVAKDEATAAQNQALLQALDKLAPSAQEGVLTPSGLMDEFKTIAGDAVVASLKGEDVSMSDKVTARFSELLQVEKDGELVNGTPTQETLSQAENLLEGGDIAGAIAAVETLDGPAADVIAPWLGKARTSLLADSLKGFLDQGVGAAAEGDVEALLPRASKFISDEKTGIQILVPGKPLGSSAYR